MTVRQTVELEMKYNLYYCVIKRAKPVKKEIFKARASAPLSIIPTFF